MINFLNIPSHTKCNNCGSCCGRILCTPVEFESIKKFVGNNIEVKKFAIKHQGKLIDCPFRDDELKKCLIYEVRPMICRLFGVAKGMSCCNGNSAEIDGLKFLETDRYQLSDMVVLNNVDWGKV